MENRVAIVPMQQRHLPAVVLISQLSGVAVWSEVALQHSLRCIENLCVVATHRDTVVGYFVAQVQRGHFADLHNIAISPSYVRQSIGSQLLDHLIRSCRQQEVNTIFLEVRESNDAAIEFYRAHSFKEVGKRKQFYQNPAEDALLLSRTV